MPGKRRFHLLASHSSHTAHSLKSHRSQTHRSLTQDTPLTHSSHTAHRHTAHSLKTHRSLFLVPSHLSTISIPHIIYAFDISRGVTLKRFLMASMLSSSRPLVLPRSCHTHHQVTNLVLPPHTRSSQATSSCRNNFIFSCFG